MTSNSRYARGRLRFDGAERSTTPDGRETIVVRLEWRDVPHTGAAHGVQTREGDIRTAASATLSAAQSVLGEGGPTLELVGVKATRAFDAWVVVASAVIRDGDTHFKVLGAKACEDGDLVRASSIAILDALNRILERYLE
ncbi:MAG: hypothetical protein RQ745_09560 [Longimicrobiales bacterium]|nr:hypothetical protein [Longimicrobiales bacterium]